MFYFGELVKSEKLPGKYELGQVQDGVDGFEDADELLRATASDGSVLYELGVDTLLPGMEDIRDRIVGNPGRVFAFQWGEGEEIDYSYIIDMPESFFQYVSLEESTLNPGKYEMGTGTEEHYASSSDFKKEYVDDGLGGTLYELGVDILPANVKDIRSFIIGSPARVFAYLFDEDYDVSYFCLTQVA